MKRHLLAVLAITLVTAWFSYAYFHLDEYFQILELTRSKLVPEDVPALPWEHAERMRSFMQPFVYWLLGRALGIRDVFALAFAARFVTGLANVAALALFLRTTLPWFLPDERAVHLRVATLAGFLPYLFVRTSSESASMAALTAGWALVLEGTPPDTWTVPGRRLLAAGLLFGLAFELRFQTAFATLGIVVWLVRVGGLPVLRLGRVALGGALAVLGGALVDRWGYGTWAFPPVSYFRANLVDGVAGIFGTDPPLAYFWLLPANVFAPVLLVLLALAVVAWVREPRHPLTWATLPLFLVHNVVPHKEERFVFPLAILATGLVTLAIRPGGKLGDRLWRRRWSWPVKVLAAFNFAPMLLLAFVPIGWNHNVRFAHFVHGIAKEEFHATATPEVELGLPPFHPRVWDVQKSDRRTGYVITDRPDLDGELLYSELPGDAPMRARLLRWVDAYNARARPPLRVLRFRSLYRYP